MQQGASTTCSSRSTSPSCAPSRKKPLTAPCGERISNCTAASTKNSGSRESSATAQMRDVIERLKRINSDQGERPHRAQPAPKELVAQAIHQNSPRKTSPSSRHELRRLSGNILESELSAMSKALHRRLGRSRGKNSNTRRHAVSRRSRRHADDHADQTAPGAGKQPDHPSRLE